MTLYNRFFQDLPVKLPCPCLECDRSKQFGEKSFDIKVFAEEDCADTCEEIKEWSREQ